MRVQLFFLIIGAATLPYVAHARHIKPEVLKAMHNGAMAEFQLKVLDDVGTPVSNASVCAVFDILPEPHTIYGKTDTNGICIAKGRTNGNYIEFLSGKDGYYGAQKKITLVEMNAEHDVKDDKWLPYGVTEVLLLRRIHKPVALHSFGFGAGRVVPVTNTWIGVDMAYGDFIKPYGKGECVDFEVMVEWDGRPPIDSNYCVANMRFVEQLSGGYYAPIIRESEYPYVYGANEKDSYDVRHVKVTCRGNARQGEACQLGNGAVLVTRTRCVLDGNGNLKSACYGFIRIFDADASWEGKPTMRLAGVFNPTPNDTNLEDVEKAKKSRHFIRQCEPPPQSEKKRKSFWPF